MWSGECRNRSSVLLTVPSLEFSTATTPKSALLASTSWNTSSTLLSASARTEWPKCLNTAAWVNVPSGPRIGDLERLLLGQARGHDLAKQARNLLITQRPLVALQGPAQHLGLTLGPVEVDGVAVAVLGDAGLLGQPRALADQFLQVLIERIDARADRRKVASASVFSWHCAS